MATRIKEPTKPLYEADFYVWARQQAELLRAGRYEELDLQNLIEEVDDLGVSLYRSVRSRVRTIVEHLLKLEHAPARGPRDLWHDTIAVQRADLEDDLTASLRARLEAELPKQYGRARAATARSRPPTRCRRPAPTRSTRSPVTGTPKRPNDSIACLTLPWAAQVLGRHDGC